MKGWQTKRWLNSLISLIRGKNPFIPLSHTQNGSITGHDRIQCNECGSRILLATAIKNEGACAICAKLSVESRQAIKTHRNRIATGDIYHVSNNDLLTAKSSDKIMTSDSPWTLEPNFYDGHAATSIDEAIKLAMREPNGHVFLVNDLGENLNFSFTEIYAVCTFQTLGSDSGFYARTPDCLNTQVEARYHAPEACPCCGEGIGWFPSRFHLPRKTAFELLQRLINSKSGSEMWIPTGDYAFTTAGEG